jgi:hypothetical protein
MAFFPDHNAPACNTWCAEVTGGPGWWAFPHHMPGSRATKPAAGIPRHTFGPVINLPSECELHHTSRSVPLSYFFPAKVFARANGGGNFSIIRAFSGCCNETRLDSGRHRLGRCAKELAQVLRSKRRIVASAGQIALTLSVIETGHQDPRQA